MSFYLTSIWSSWRCKRNPTIPPKPEMFLFLRFSFSCQLKLFGQSLTVSLPVSFSFVFFSASFFLNIVKWCIEVGRSYKDNEFLNAEFLTFVLKSSLDVSNRSDMPYHCWRYYSGFWQCYSKLFSFLYWVYGYSMGITITWEYTICFKVFNVCAETKNIRAVLTEWKVSLRGS